MRYAVLFGALLLLAGCANTYNEQIFAKDSVKVYAHVNVGTGNPDPAVAAILAEQGWPLVWFDVIRQGTEATSKGQAQVSPNVAVTGQGNTEATGTTGSNTEQPTEQPTE